MKIEDQVCILEQSKKLKELGIIQNSYFYWHLGVVSEKWVLINSEHSHISVTDEYSAFTCSELGKMLYPNQITSNVPKLANHKWVLYDKYIWGNIEVCRKTEVSARASLLIYFIETGNINVKDCNKRLKT